MIVVDTCIAFHLFNESDCHEMAEELLENDPIWIIPPIWQDEYGNILTKMAVKEKRSAIEVQAHYLEMLQHLKNNEVIINKSDALQLAITKKISFYDANFVALARYKNVWLVTEDREIVKKCPEYAMTLNQFLSSN